MAERNKKDDVRKNNQSRFFGCKSAIHAFFSLLKVKKFNVEHVNDRLKRICLIYMSDSTISRFHGHANACFEMLQIYLRATECNPDKAMTVCCSECCKLLRCYILLDLYCV